MGWIACIVVAVLFLPLWIYLAKVWWELCCWAATGGC